MQLVYEPTWNQPGSEGASVIVPADDWATVSITPDSGLFSQTGGFGQTNSAGGPPLKTLLDWSTTFDSQFLNAELVTVSVGVGTYNQGQTGYFDDVTIGTDVTLESARRLEVIHASALGDLDPMIQSLVHGAAVASSSDVMPATATPLRRKR